MGIAALICGLLAQDLHGDPLPEGALARLGTTRFRAPHSVGPIALSADGAVIAAFEHGGGVFVWDAATGRVRRRFSPKRGPDATGGMPPGLALSADGRRVAAGSYDDRVRVWDTSSGAELFIHGGFGDRVSSLALSPDGKLLAVLAIKPPLTLCDVDSGRIRVPAPPPERLRAAAFSPDGRRLALSARGIYMLDPETGVHSRRVVTLGITGSLAWSPDGRRLATVVDLSKVEIFDADSGEEKSRERKSQATASDTDPSFLWFGKNGKTLIFNDDRGLVSWDPDAGETATLLEHKPWSGPLAAAGDLLAEADGHRVRLRKDGRAVEAPIGHETRISGVALSPDGRLAATAAGDQVLLWNADQGRLLRTLPFPSGGLRAVAFSPDARRVAAGGVNFGLTVWEVETGASAWSAAQGPGGSLTALAWSPDGANLAVADAGGRMRVYDAASGAPLFDPPDRMKNVTGLAYVDPRTIVRVGDQVAKLVSAETGKEFGLLEGHASDLSAVAVSPDGSRIVTASIHMNAKRDGTLRVWESFSGELLRVIDPSPAYPAQAIALGPDGRTLATFRFFQDEIRFWNIATGRPAGSLPGQPNGGEALAVGGGRLLSGGMDTSALVWTMPASPADAAPAPDLEKAWDELLTARGKDLDPLLDAIVAAGAKAVDVLLPRCRPRIPTDADKAKTAEWIGALESENDLVKEEAVERLIRCPWRIEPLLTGETLFLEAKELQAKIRLQRNPPPPRMTGEALRRRRAIQVLERLGAKEALKELAESFPAAGDALRRLR